MIMILLWTPYTFMPHAPWWLARIAHNLYFERCIASYCAVTLVGGFRGPNYSYKDHKDNLKVYRDEITSNLRITGIWWKNLGEKSPTHPFACVVMNRARDHGCRFSFLVQSSPSYFFVNPTFEPLDFDPNPNTENGMLRCPSIISYPYLKLHE